MTTPILDFLSQYAQGGYARLHMPGHKGHHYVGPEAYDITEIAGADQLYCPEGIIAASEANAARLFGTARTVYSCGGASQCIMATLWLLAHYAAQTGGTPYVLAARNVHQSFVSALAQTGLEVEWMCPSEELFLSCPVSAEALETHLRGVPKPPIAVYVTSPDYLGNVQPIEALAEVCHRHGVLLVVDNAHGAYLHFVENPSRHPIQLGADICCDSAHKTLPVLTGGAYLHFAATAPAFVVEQAKNAMLLVGSTSPSYLLLASLDKANALLAEDAYTARLSQVAQWVAEVRARLTAHGWVCLGNEPLKLTLHARAVGQDGTAIAARLRAERIELEYASRDYVVLMVSADTSWEELQAVERLLLAVECAPKVGCAHPFVLPPKAMTVREAYLSPHAILPLATCVGKVLGYCRVLCPPAVPLLMPGEVVEEALLPRLVEEGYTHLEVVQ